MSTPSTVRSLCAAALTLSLGVPATIARADGLPGCPGDPVLTRAAAVLLLEDDRQASGAIARALRSVGSDAVGVRALFVEQGGGGEAIEAWLTEMGAAADARLVCGEAFSEAGRLVMATASGGGLSDLAPDTTLVRGWLAPDFVDAHLMIVDANGALSRHQVTPATLADGVPLPKGVERPALVQLMASGRSGPRPIAERVAPGRAGAVGPGGPAGAPIAASEEHEQRSIKGSLNRLRRARGKRPVRRNRLLRDAARRHAREVCESGRVAHVLASGEDPAERLKRFGVAAGLVGETVARAAGPGAAFDALQRSPAHLATMLGERFTDAGVGLSRDEAGKTCMVVVLASWPRYVGR